MNILVKVIMITLSMSVVIGALLYWAMNNPKFYKGKNIIGIFFIASSVLFLLTSLFLPFLNSTEAVSVNTSIGYNDVLKNNTPSISLAVFVFQAFKNFHTPSIIVNGLAMLLLAFLIGYLQKRAYRHGLAILLLAAFLFAYATIFIANIYNALALTGGVVFSSTAIVSLFFFVLYFTSFLIHILVYIKKNKIEPIQ